MNNRRLRLAVYLSCTAFLLAYACNLALAQNENETVGFQSNHLFESGQFGEDIDVLNGGLNLTIPIGPRYQVNQNLGYQLSLMYNSKIWDMSRWDEKSKLERRGSMGLGFHIHFGRIYRDVEFTGTNPDTADEPHECTWYYMSPDGNEHRLPGSYRPDQHLDCSDLPLNGYTTDGSFYHVTNTIPTGWDGITGPTPTFTVTTPDGIIYTFGQFVQVSTPSGRMNSTGASGEDGEARATQYNRDFGGWYVTRIEDVRSNHPTNYVNITYDTTKPGWNHVIKTITDSLGRTITFNNSCVADAGTSSGCVEDAAMPKPCVGPPPHLDCNWPYRASARTDSITIPAFKPSTVVETPTSTLATYRFSYDFLALPRPNTPGLEPATHLLRVIEYPGASPTYTMSFSYGLLGTQYGEIDTRTLPTGAAVRYFWDEYAYSAATRDNPSPQIAMRVRQLISKSLSLTPGEANPPTWTYTREAQLSGTSYSNPKYVIVKDPLGNETIYYYRASHPKLLPPPTYDRYDTEDGFAPEWNDGVNYKIEYYQGSGGARKLVRTETQEHDADQRLSDKHRDKQNVRVIRYSTIYDDDGGKRSTVTYRDWDGRGHWEVMSEAGDDIVGARMTRTKYRDYDPDDFLFREVSDSSKVLSRTDNNYSSLRLILSIQRVKLPATLGTPHNTVAQAGDLKTEYDYDSNGNVLEKRLTTKVGLVNPEYKIRYVWQGGGYLATKQFFDWSTSAYFNWLAIDRSRDGNTGLIFASRDSAGVETRYAYDALGRLTEITPAGTEYPTQVKYVDIRQTILRQGERTLIESKNSCAAGLTSEDYIMSCYHYDTLGRLIKKEERPYDGSLQYPYQTRLYDILGRVLFESEWLWPGQASVGTTYDYSDPGAPSQKDPFGRPRKVTVADSTPPNDKKETLTEYFGLSRTVTVGGVRGVGGARLDQVTTRYTHDVWDRLVHVQAPANGGADATYTYDLRDDLIRVDLLDKANLSQQSRTFEYDALSRLHTTVNPESGAEVVAGIWGESGYDSLGNVIERKDASGNRFISTYDGAGRLLRFERRDYQQPGAPTPPLVILQENTYDQNPAEFGQSGGRLTTVLTKGDSGTLVHTRKLYYSGLNGRLSNEQNIFASWSGPLAAVVHTYNNFGLVSGTTYPEGAAGQGGAFSVTYTYANGYPTEVRDPSQPPSAQLQASATYNAAGGFQEISTPGPARTVIQPDIRNRPSRITIGMGTYDSGMYQYDGAGNIYQIGSNNYAYDRASRLVEALDIYGTDTRRETYQYDDYGNMTEKKHFLNGTQTAFDTLTVRDQTTGRNTNRLLTLQQLGDTALRSFEYDARGNLTLSDTQAAKRRLIYDSRNRLTNLRSLAGSMETDVARYVYDGAASRLRKEVMGGDLWTFFVRDGQGRLISEFRRTRGGSYTPEWTKHYLYLGDRLVGLRENRVPSPPGALTATTSSANSTVTLTWKPSPQGEAEAVTKYKIYRSLYSQLSWELRGTTVANVTTYVDSVTTGTLYQYVVTACVGPCLIGSDYLESYGQGVLVILGGDTSRPAAPSGLQAKSGDRRVDLTWSANSGIQWVVGYHVYRRTTGTAVRITQVPVVGTSFTDQGVNNAWSYYYSLTAVDSAGLESLRSAEVPATPNDFTPPAVPQRLAATPDCNGTSTISLSWEPNVATDMVNNYVLFRDPPFPGGTSVYVGGAQTTYTDANTTPGTSYTYYVKAADANNNVSDPSLFVTVTARHPAGTVPTPTLPYALSGDGKVDLRLVVSSDAISLPAVRVYRKPNVELSCVGYELLAEVATAGRTCVGPAGSESCFVDFTDGGAPNGVAHDYAVTNVDNLGRESGYSATALGLPVARLANYRACREELGRADDGTANCGGISNPRYNRIALRWDTPGGAIYQPLTATNADGDRGYFKGVRVYKYNLNDGQTTLDHSALAPQRIDSGKGHCSNNPDNFCGGGVFCPQSGDTCSFPSENPDVGRCSIGNTYCMMDGDCPAGETCSRDLPTDPYLVMYGDERAYTPNVWSFWGSDCLSVKGVYKVYANGNWLTVESGFSDNFNVNQRADHLNRCLGSTPDVCQGIPPFCPPPIVQPPVPDKPTAVATGPGEITVTWSAPLSGLCQLTDPAPCPGPTWTCPSTDQFCSEEDAWKCRLTTPRACNTDTECTGTPSQTCVPVASQVGGYRLYAIEATGAYEPLRYHATRPVPFISLNRDQVQYTFKGLSGSSFTFRVATVDLQGQVSKWSAPSDPRSPGAPVGSIPAPGGVKTIIWTVNDATSVGNGGVFKSIREMEGIKVTWRDGGYTGLSGFRVYRSTTRGDPNPCALVRSGPGAVPNVCPGDRTSGPYAAYSETLSTGPSGNNRLFVDTTAQQGVTYYYTVKAVTTSGESPSSVEVKGMALEHPSQPLSPPAYFKAWAPNSHFVGLPPGTLPEYKGIYLRWCPNPAVEGVTEYQIHRAVNNNSPKGPFKPLIKVPPACLDSDRRCEINLSNPADPTSPITLTQIVAPQCQTGMDGNCRIVDLTVTQPSSGVDANIYNYVVTALRGSQESGYSVQNEGWPHYEPLWCDTFPPIKNCKPRYDPDNFPDTFCGDEISELGGDAVPIARAESSDGGLEPAGDLDPDLANGVSVAHMAPYRTIGQASSLPSMPVAAPKFVYYHLDHLGSPRVITDVNGNVVSQHHYMPFGEELPVQAMNSGNKRHFTGHERDSESGLDYMVARYYVEDVGRFMSPDPSARSVHLRFPLSWNRYSYVVNNPLKYVDSDGRQLQWFWKWIARLLVGGRTRWSKGGLEGPPIAVPLEEVARVTPEGYVIDLQTGLLLHPDAWPELKLSPSTNGFDDPIGGFAYQDLDKDGIPNWLDYDIDGDGIDNKWDLDPFEEEPICTPCEGDEPDPSDPEEPDPSDPEEPDPSDPEEPDPSDPEEPDPQDPRKPRGPSRLHR